MKKTIRLLLMTALAAVLLCAGALAAEAPAIRVQLDGQELTFTDAAPQVRDQRTFLPFRAVFEAMGAEVDYEGSVITAVKDGKALTMTIGSTQAQVTENGKAGVITMDVAPYVDPETWRTYVPVRFAAQAFGCSVGWDQGAYTAIIVDTDKLVSEAARGRSFTTLEKYAAYAEKFNEGVWDVEMTMNGAMALDLGGAVLNLPTSVAARGTMEDQTKVDMDMTMKVDCSQITALLSAGGLTGADLSAFDTLLDPGMGISVRGDLDAGTLYMNMTGGFMEEAAGYREDTWYALDLDGSAAQAGLGMNFASLMAAAKENGAQSFYTAMAKYFLGRLTLTEAAEGGSGVSYGVFKNSAENLALALSDEGFQADGDALVTSIDGGQQGMVFSLAMKDGAVVGCTQSLYITDSTDDSATEMSVNVSMDEQDRMTGKMDITINAPLDEETALSLRTNFDIAGSYAPGTVSPETQIPTGAKVADFDAKVDAQR